MIYFLVGTLLFSLCLCCYKLGVSNEKSKNDKIISDNNKKVIKALNTVDDILNNSDFGSLQDKYKRK